MLSISVGDRIEFSYKNQKGEHAKRAAVVKDIAFAYVEWHEGKQWIMTAFDLDKRADRYFAMRDTHNIKKINKSII